MNAKMVSKMLDMPCFVSFAHSSSHREPPTNIEYVDKVVWNLFIFIRTLANKLASHALHCIAHT